MKRTFVGKTKNGVDVFVDLNNSDAATHLRDTEGLFEVSQEAIARIDAEDKHIEMHIDMGREVGMCDLVKTDETDDTFYAKRLGRKIYSRFVKNKSARPTNYITIVLDKQSDGSYHMLTVFFGRVAPPFPYGKDDPNDEARGFWSKHALVVGNQVILEDTIRYDCPW